MRRAAALLVLLLKAAPGNVRSIAALTLALLAIASAAGAEAMPVPPKLQMAIFKRVFQYDRTLAGKGPVQVLVVHNDMPARQLEELLATFRWAEIAAVPVHVAELAQRIRPGSVVYILPGVSPAAFMAHCAAHEALTISGLPALAQGGSVSIAIGAGGDGRPEILVHRGRLKVEKHDISAELLKLARILQ
ncbi:MAG TPA: hypothetical protein VF121_06475 [Thermoanaerobaculia bacterium]|nr:hypothetical protein [Thermoanaerobaculia bacterium]